MVYCSTMTCSYCWTLWTCSKHSTSIMICFVCFRQKTAYDMRISDWSSDVCSSDLADDAVALLGEKARVPARRPAVAEAALRAAMDDERDRQFGCGIARKSVVQGKSVSVSVDLGGGRIITKKNWDNQDLSIDNLTMVDR